MTTEGKKHISNSQLELFSKCAEAYRRRYIENDKRPPRIAMQIGSGVHYGAEVNFRQKIESHENLPASEIIDAAVAGFEQRLSVDGYELSPDEQSRGARLVVADAKDTVASLADLHSCTQSIDYQPTATETATTIILPDCSRDLVAITDLRDDKGHVVDFKTASKRPSAYDAHSSLQLTIVAAAYQVDVGTPCTDVRLDVLVKTKTPARHVLVSDRDERDFAALAARIDTTVRAIDAGIFTPASPSHWMCSPTWCAYFQTCKFVSNRRT